MNSLNYLDRCFHRLSRIPHVVSFKQLKQNVFCPPICIVRSFSTACVKLTFWGLYNFTPLRPQETLLPLTALGWFCLTAAMLSTTNPLSRHLGTPFPIWRG